MNTAKKIGVQSLKGLPTFSNGNFALSEGAPYVNYLLKREGLPFEEVFSAVGIVSNDPTESPEPRLGWKNISGRTLLLKAGYDTTANGRCSHLVMAPEEIFLHWSNGDGYSFSRYKIFGEDCIFPVRERGEYEIALQRAASCASFTGAATPDDLAKLILAGVELGKLNTYSSTCYSAGRTLGVRKSPNGNVILIFHEWRDTSGYGNYDTVSVFTYSPTGELLDPKPADPNSKGSARKVREAELAQQWYQDRHLIEVDEKWTNQKYGRVYIQRSWKDDVEFFDLRSLRYGAEFSGHLRTFGGSHTGFTEYVYARTLLSTITIDCASESHGVKYAGWELAVRRIDGRRGEDFFIASRKADKKEEVYIARAAYLGEKYGSLDSLLADLESRKPREVKIEDDRKVVLLGLTKPYLLRRFGFIKAEVV